MNCMRVLGISCYFHDSAAAILRDGQLVAAAEEERFTRIKHDYGFPYHAIKFCLDFEKIDGKELDYVVFFEKPFLKFDRILKSIVNQFPKTYSLFIQSMRTWMVEKLWIKSLISRTLDIDSSKILFVEHHMSHAASSFFCSPFDSAAVVTFDGVGEWATTTIGYGCGNSIDIRQELTFPHSIGLLYSVFTAFLGFEVNEGEYKVMGMAPYGEPKYLDKVWKLVQQFDDGSYLLNQEYFSFQYSTKHTYTKRFADLFGKSRDPEVPFFTRTSEYPSYFEPRPHNYDQIAEYNQYYADIAASIQVVTEELTLGVVRQAYKETASKNLCLAGGVALNSVANARILRETPFEHLYIQPSAGDGGCALGAALFAWRCVLGHSDKFIMRHASWGAEYVNDEIKNIIDEQGLEARYIEDTSELIDASVDQLLQGRVIGWFQGRFEWGPRALGNRSILADPRMSSMKDLVNTKIKFREPFRPFAPSILAESSKDFFSLSDPGGLLPAQFMLLVEPINMDKQALIPAVNHMGTARLQTVHPDLNARYYDLIERFSESSGVPLLLNTSFNIRGEPIVNSPSDALETFRNSGLDSLIMENFFITK